VSPASAAARPDTRDRTLGNGLRILVEARPGAGGVSVELVVPVGAAHDPDDLPGATALLWEWQDRGAGGRTLRARRDAFARLGVRQGGGAGRTHSGISATMLADALPAALPLLADELVAPHLDEDEFGRARQHALEAIEALDDRPAERLDEALAARTLRGRHGRSVYGDAAALAASTPRRVRAHRAATVGPEGALVAIVGDLDPDQVLERTAGSLEGWRGAAAPNAGPVAWAPAARHGLEADVEQTQLGWSWPLLPPADPRTPALALGLAALTTGGDARLVREVRELRGLAYAVEAGTRAVPGAAWATATLATTPDRAREAEEVAAAELRRLAAGVTADELARARALLRTREASRAETGAGRAGQLVRDVLLRGAPRGVQERLAALARPSRDEVNAALAAAPCAAPVLVALGPGAGA
jgi:predicted Zn-dependent peptidase